MPSTARLSFGLVGIAVIFTAFLRGNYLFGLGCGITYVFVTAVLIWLVAQSFTRKNKMPLIPKIGVIIVSVLIGYAITFPASINPDVQFGIDCHTTDRTVRKELKQVFRSDPAFADLSISIEHTKVNWITISGTLPSRTDLIRFRERITSECQTLEHFLLVWRIVLQDTNELICGTDCDQFPPNDE